MQSNNKNIKFNNQEIKKHSKASEKYVDVTFGFENRETWEGWIPVYYRRSGLFLENKKEIVEHIELVYDLMRDNSYSDWISKEKEFWDTEKSRAKVTRGFFDELSKGGWKCVNCELPSNPNFARRIQDLKEFGYTIATNTSGFCNSCGETKTKLNMVPIKRYALSGNGYETWSPTLRKRIMKILKNYDVYEAKVNTSLLPDHKFPEIRWDGETKAENPDSMIEKEVKDKFQLMSNQRNLQKREVCRKCYQDEKRGYPFGIKYYYEGNQEWNSNIPKRGAGAEEGCKGCGWYDMEKWRIELQKKL